MKTLKEKNKGVANKPQNSILVKGYENSIASAE